MIGREDFRPNATVREILPEAFVTVVSVGLFVCEALEISCKGPSARVADQLLSRQGES